MKGENATIDVSVIVLTYYHEGYISRALDSILEQLTSLNMEIIVSDDCSKDKTREIVSEYAKRYPNMIRTIFHKENIGISKNMFEARCAAKGRFITQLSGDDYYININKIQEQYDYLNSHTDIVAVTTVIESRYDSSDTEVMSYPIKRFRGKEFTIKDFAKGYDFPMHGVMFRNFYATEAGKEYMSLMPKASQYVDDITDELLLLQKGKVFIIDESMYAYRINRNKNGHNFNSKNNQMRGFEKHVSLLNNIVQDDFGRIQILNMRYAKVVAPGIIGMIICHEWKEFVRIYKSIPVEVRKNFLFHIKCAHCLSEYVIGVISRKIKGFKEQKEF